MHLSFGSGCAFVLALVGCGSPPAPATHEPVTTLVMPTASAAAPLPVAPPPTAHVEAHGCSFGGVSPDRFVVSFDGLNAAASFALVQSPTLAKVFLGATRGQPNAVDVDVFGLHFDAQLPDNGIPLHAQAPLGLADVYDPASYVRIEWQLLPGDDAAKGLLASVKSELGLIPFEKRISCTEVGVDVVKKLPARDLPLLKGWARAIAPLELAPSPDASPVARIPHGRIVTVYGGKSGKTEISVESDGLWHGWVPDASLKKVTDPGAGGYGMGSGHGRPASYPGFSCPTALPLYVREKGTQSTPIQVGTVRANAHVGLAASGDSVYRALVEEQRETNLDRGVLTIQPRFELVVSQSASAACVPHTTPSPDAALEGPDSDPANARFTLVAVPAKVAVDEASDLVFENLASEPFRFRVAAQSGCHPSDVAIELVDSRGAHWVQTAPGPRAVCAITRPAHTSVYRPGKQSPTKLETHGPWFPSGATSAADGQSLKPGSYQVVLHAGGGLLLRTKLTITAKK